jgi:hypothetical protein
MRSPHRTPMLSAILFAVLGFLAFGLAATSAPVRACPGQHCPTLP